MRAEEAFKVVVEGTIDETGLCNPFARLICG